MIDYYNYNNDLGRVSGKDIGVIGVGDSNNTRTERSSTMSFQDFDRNRIAPGR
eukprot:Pgem_evm1s15684